VLFVGAAMGITAFPVLARILSDRKLTHTRIGTFAISCAAVDDVSAWCMLAIITVIARPNAIETGLPLRFAALGVYVCAQLQFSSQGVRWTPRAVTPPPHLRCPTV
jgi:Kef-type K+ transport system membrane component KefB